MATKQTLFMNFLNEFQKTSIDLIKVTYLQVFEFHKTMSIVYQQCYLLERMELLDIDRNKTYKDVRFDTLQEVHRGKIKTKAQAIFKLIKEQIEALGGQFQDGPNDIQQEWKFHIISIDKKILNSLLECVRLSLHTFSTVISNEKNVGEPQTLFHCSIILKNGRVECCPSMIDLTNTVNMLAKDLIGIVKVIPRLEDSLQFTNDGLSDEINQFFFYDKISSDDTVLQLVVRIMSNVASSASKVQQQALECNKYEALWNMDKNSFLRRYSKASKSLQCFDQDISFHREQQSKIESEESYRLVNFIKLNFASFKNTLVKHSIDWQEKITKLLESKARTQLAALDSFFDDNIKKLFHIPQNVDELKSILQVFKIVTNQQQKSNEEIRMLEKTYKVLHKFDAKCDDESIQQLQKLPEKFETLQDTIHSAEVRVKKCERLIQENIENLAMSFVSNKKELKNILADTIYGKNQELTIDDLRIKLQLLKTKTNEIRADESELVSGLDFFGMDIPDDKILRDCENNIDQFDAFIQLNEDWYSFWEEWMGNAISKLNTVLIDKKVGIFLTDVMKFRKEMRNMGVWKELQTSMQQVKKVIPLVGDLKNEAMRDRHWISIGKQIGRSYNFSVEKITLNDIFFLGLHAHHDFIQDLSSKARKELSIEHILCNIESNWSKLEITLTPYKDTFKIMPINKELSAALDNDSKTLSYTRKESTFTTHFELQICEMEKKLFEMQDMICTLFGAQEKWLYLENVFTSSSSVDLNKEFPNESSLFEKTDEDFHTIMQHCNDNKKLYALVCADIIPSGLRQNLLKNLGIIQNCVECYVERFQNTTIAHPPTS